MPKPEKEKDRYGNLLFRANRVRPVSWDMGDPKVHVKIDIMNQLMKLRNIKNIAELAKAIDVHPSNLYRINAGKVLPNYTTLARMCLVLGCQPADLLYVDYNFSD